MKLIDAVCIIAAVGYCCIPLVVYGKPKKTENVPITPSVRNPGILKKEQNIPVADDEDIIDSGYSVAEALELTCCLDAISKA